VENNATKMRDIFVQAQKYMQIEETTRAATGRLPKQGPEVEKPKPRFLSSKNPSHTATTVYKPLRCALKSSKKSAAEPGDWSLMLHIYYHISILIIK